MTLPRIGADAELNLDKWSRSIQTMLRDAQLTDAALDQIVGKLNVVEGALAFGGGVHLALAVDTSDIEHAVDLQQLLQQNTAFVASADESDIETAIDLQSGLDENTAFVAGADEGEIKAAVGLQAELDENTSFTANVSDSEIKQAVGLQAELEQNTAFKAGVDSGEIDQAKRKHDDLDANTSFTVNVNDTEIDSAKRKRDDLDANTTLTVNVQDTEIQNALDDIKSMQVVDIAINIAQPAVDFFKNAATFSVGGIVEMDAALNKLEGTTGRMIPGAEHLINDLYVNAWGESRTQIADVIALATQLGISQTDLAGAIESAFQVASVTGYDVTEVLKAQDSLVKNELVKDYKQAGDVIVAGFQTGGDRANDLLETLVEYGSTFDDLGLSAEEATNILVNAMNNGFKNTDLAADALREFNIRVRDLNDAAAQGAIERLGLKDAATDFRNGTIAGDEFLSLVITKLNEMEDPAQRQITAVEIFGTQLEDIGTSAIKGLDPTVKKLGDVRDRAEDASDKVNDNLATAFTELKRTVEVELGDFLNETFDIDGLIDKMKTGVATFFEELNAGENMFAAMEIAFDLPGLENTMQGIQRTFADIGIAMLQVVSEIMSILGKDNSAIQKTIADLSAVQLRADIFAADSEEGLVSSIERALGRGVDKADIGNTVAAQIQSMIDSGDFEGAISLMDMLSTEFTTDQLDFSPLGNALQAELNMAFSEAFNTGNTERVLELAPMITFTPDMDQAVKDKILAILEDPIRRFNESDVVIDYARLLSNSTGEIDFETLGSRVGAPAAQEISDALWTGLSSSIAAQDWNAALDYGQLLGRDELGTTMDDLLAEVARLDMISISETASGIMDAIGGIFSGVSETETQVETDGESITTTFSDVGESAAETEKNVDKSTGAMSKAVNREAGNIDSSGRDISGSFRDLSKNSGTAAQQVSGDFRQMDNQVSGSSERVRGSLAPLIAQIESLGKSAPVVFATIGKSAGEMGGAVMKGLADTNAGVSAAGKSLGDALTNIRTAFEGNLKPLGAATSALSKTLTTDMGVAKTALDGAKTAVSDLGTTGVSKLNALSASSQTTGNDLTNMSNNGQAAIFGLRDNGNAALDTLSLEYSSFVTAWGTETDRLIALVNASNAAIAGMQSPPAPSGTGTGTTTGGGGAGFQADFAEGGLSMPGVNLFGEDGPELAFADTRLAVLNNQTTEALIAGMAALGGGGGSSETNIYMTNNFYTNTPAQDLSSMGMASRALRGFN